MAAVGVIIVCSMIAFMELPKLIKEKLTKEIIIFSLFLLFATILAIIAALRIELPNPIDWLMMIFVPINHWLDSMLS